MQPLMHASSVVSKGLLQTMSETCVENKRSFDATLKLTVVVSEIMIVT